MISPASYNILFICAVLIVGLAVLACLYWGIKIIAHSRVKHVRWHIALLTVWLLTIPTAIITSACEAGNYKHHNETGETVSVKANDTIYLDMFPSELKISNNFRVYYDRKEACFYGKPEIFIRKSSDGNVRLETVKGSLGRNKLMAFEYAEDIGYGIEVLDSLIIFPPYFTVEPKSEWKCQHLDVILYIPENTVIISGKSLCHADIVRFWSRRGHSCKYIMTKDGLRTID
jgi:hypothetical protein